ncbi:MAG TPA: FAD-dependent oxidoreductase [Candidatus Eisenbacteria bacterium]|nr:FAD-dependent oxidoreductase [Candidatus Eisenbacteria bacterium]
MAEDPTYVIVGASLAGAKAAAGLREAGFEGRVLLVGEERDRPYERPPLSKDYLKGAADRDKIFVHDEGWYVEHHVELMLGATVTGLHRDARQVELAGGERLPYDKLLLATGSVPRRLSLPGGDLEGVHYLRRVGESEAIRDALTSGGSLVVVGGGWIGLEVAAAGRHYGASVTVIEPQPTPLYAVLGREVGEIFAALHREHGVDLRLGSGVTAFEGEGGRVTGVVTSDGETVPADAVVVGVGIVPNTRLAEAAGLEVDNGVVVDELLRSSDPDIYAAGDVANAFNPLLRARLRVEHWANASNQGKAAGQSMAGHGEPYAKLPYFYTDQYDLSMEYHGWVGPDGYDDVVLRGDPASGEWLAFWLYGGRVLAGMNVNVWDQSDPIKRLARERAAVDRARLADPAVPLDSL